MIEHELPLRNIAIENHEKDFTELEELISDYIGENGCIPYHSVLHLLAMRYLGAGLVSTEIMDQGSPIEVREHCLVCSGILVIGDALF